MTFQSNSLEYSDDSEEVFEKEDFDDFDRTVSTYLDELETNSPKSKHTWSRPMLEMQENSKLQRIVLSSGLKKTENQLMKKR